MNSEYLKICVQLLQDACTKNHSIPSQQTVFHSIQIPHMTIHDYAKRIAKYSNCSEECFILAVIYVHRYVKFSGHAITFYNVHRLLITTVMLAAKVRDDVFYSNGYYSGIGGITKSELNNLEINLCSTLQWELFVKPEEFYLYTSLEDAPSLLNAPPVSPLRQLPPPAPSPPQMTSNNSYSGSSLGNDESSGEDAANNNNSNGGVRQFGGVRVGSASGWGSPSKTTSGVKAA